MKTYFDTEFEDLRAGAGLLSIGLITEAGAEIYIELTDGWDIDECSPFVLDHVIPLFDADAGDKCSHAEAGIRVLEFLKRHAENHSVELVSDSEWDWNLLLSLFASQGAERVGNRMQVSGIQIHFSMAQWRSPVAASVFQDAYAGYFSGDNPEQLYYLPHHALVDARALRHACLIAQRLELSE